MEHTWNDILALVSKEYGIPADEIAPMAMGVGGDTFRLSGPRGKFIYKESQESEMNHPKAEASLCDFLLQKGIPVAEYIRNRNGDFPIDRGNGRIPLLYRYVEGQVLAPNTAPQWFLQQSPLLLAKIHMVMQDYIPLAYGLGKPFFDYMTPERAKNSYLESMELAKQQGETAVLDALEFRYGLMDKIKDWHFDVDRLTYRNTHGDYTINQIICGDDRINAVIDWTSACRHPVVWEITRSFFYAEPTCAGGYYDEKRFKDYVDLYCSIAALNQYDRDHLLTLYYYQIAVCDYYSQYLHAEEDKKDGFLTQAEFATKVLRNSGIV